MVEVEVQNETYQTQQVIRFASVPRIGEGIHLVDHAGFSACFDVIDVWYQKANYGDVWIPYIHVRKTPGISAAAPGASNDESQPFPAAGREHAAALADRFS